MRAPVTTPLAALPLGLLATTLVSMVATAACLTDPPPDLQLGSQPPTISHVALYPPEGLVMALPGKIPEFHVPVQIEDPSLGCFYSVFVDLAPLQPYVCQACPAEVTAGVTMIPIDLSTLDQTTQHTIKFTVGSSPSRQGDVSCLVENDTATWYYEPDVLYDAGALEDGAFPEAGSDALLLTGVDP